VNLEQLQLDFNISNAPSLHRQRIVIAYDTPDHRRRRKLARCALSYGERVQQSVFEALLTDAQVRVLTRTLSSLALPAEDNIRLYPQCARCANLRQVIGHGSITATVESDNAGQGQNSLGTARLIVA
jgi:CRISPR-associated protein Cas2